MPANNSKRKNEANQGDASLTQVRELLFGAQTRDFENRFGELTTHLQDGLTELRGEMSRRLDALEQSLRKEITDVTNQVAQQRTQTDDQQQKLAATLREELAKRAEELGRRLEQAERDLKQHTLKQTQNLWDDLRARYEDLSNHLDDELQKLRSESAERSALGEMFREMADRITAESKAG